MLVCRPVASLVRAALARVSVSRLGAALRRLDHAVRLFTLKWNSRKRSSYNDPTRLLDARIPVHKRDRPAVDIWQLLAAHTS